MNNIKETTAKFSSSICLACDGIANFICSSCSGTGCSADGNRPDDFGPWINCSCCGGAGALDCTDCGGLGTGEKRCPNCDNKTDWLREDCDGTNRCESCWETFENDTF